MSSDLLLSLDEVALSFGKKKLFENLTVHIHDGVKIALVGKNGTGKTTLMKLIMGDIEPDDGERWCLQGVTIGYLQQQVKFKEGQTVADFVFEGAKSLDEIEHQYKVDQILQPLELSPDDMMKKLSGGQARRAALARALVEQPDILMLDEPTNHLDLHVIEWLENYLHAYKGSVLCISHDKRFLENMTNRIFWLDRGNIRICPKGFGHFEEWSTMLMEQEERELRNRQKLLDQELEWANRGVKARRKRNVRRLELVRAEKERLKADKSSFNRMMARIEVEPIESPLNSRVAAEFFKVSKSFEDKKILDQFSLRIMKGDRIGILGKNGSGKTTFLKTLLGHIEPDQGKVKRALALEVSYFDQKREDLNQNHSIQRVLCPDGGDYVDVRGKMRHVCGYMKDFLFDPDQVRDPVRILSGGQQNRLLLAKILANPKDMLILDEPTNDLDMDTLDMLEEILIQYKGTLLIVSHDRDFLDQTVTKMLAFEGDGEIHGCIGGYSDYLREKKQRESDALKAAAHTDEESQTSKASDKNTQKDAEQDAQPEKSAPKEKKKLSYKVKYELETLPQEIEDTAQQVKDLEKRLTDPTLYQQDPDLFYQLTEDFSQAKQDLAAKEERWLELTILQEEVAS